MDYTIRHVATERELDDALAFEKQVFGVAGERHSPAYSREKWLERMRSPYNDMMLYAESGGEIAGIVFGRAENEHNATVGPVAVDERCRKHGVAKELMLTLEQRASAHGIHNLALGAVESAEGFYQKLGYAGFLLIQSEKHSVDELLALNTGYRVRYTNVYEGVVSQVGLDLPVPDRALQLRYETELPGCFTQMVFSKTI